MSQFQRQALDGDSGGQALVTQETRRQVMLSLY